MGLRQDNFLAGLGIEGDRGNFTVVPILNNIALALSGKFTEPDRVIFSREEQNKHTVFFEDVCFGDSIHLQITGLHFGGLCVGFQHGAFRVVYSVSPL